MERRNVTVDLSVPPVTLMQITAHAIYDLLAQYVPGTHVSVAEVDDAIVRAGGRLGEVKATAVKALRNGGTQISAHKRRHLSTYVLAPSAFQINGANEHRRDEAYSEWITKARAAAGAAAANPRNVSLRAEVSMAEDVCIHLGRSLGIPLPEIVSEMVPR